MKRRSRSKQSAPLALLTGIAVSGFVLGGMVTHTFHKNGVGVGSDPVMTLTSEERAALADFRSEIDKAKQATLLAVNAEDTYYAEISKTQKARADVKETKKELLERILTLEAEKVELTELQELARLEKLVAEDAVVRSQKATSQLEDHTISAYETTLEARAKLKKAQDDQTKADGVLNRFAELESEINSTKTAYASLEAKYQLVLNDNHRLANKPPQVQREIVVVNNTSNTSSDHYHNTPAPYCPPTPVYRPQSRQPVCPPASPAPSKKYKRYK